MIKFKGGGTVPGVSRAFEVETDKHLVDEVDVVIIGGGFIGCLTALNLAERGISVALCEKGCIAGEASGRAAGLIEYEHLSSIKMDLIARSMEVWREMPERINAEIGYQGSGLMTLYKDEKPAVGAKEWIDSMQGISGMQARMLTAKEIQQIDPALGSDWHSALYQPNGAAIEPRLAAPAIASGARAKGAKLFQNCAVRVIERQAGNISGVITEKGKIKTAKVVVAGGAWSSSLASQLDLKLPQLMIFAEMISVEPLSNGPVVNGMTPAGYFRREPDGGYMFGTAAGVIPITPTILKNLRDLMSMPMDVDQEIYPSVSLSTFIREINANSKQVADRPSIYEQHRILQPEYVGETSGSMVDGMRKYIPTFADAKIRERYTGSLFASLDNLGVLSSVRNIPGLFLGTGMLYGVTTSAAVGEALADMITGATPQFDISPYRYERFIDGSKFEFHP
jgi:glycine/D-amino acid oxidase-like deaminating enzyme